MGIESLGYIGVKVSNPDAWSTFMTDVLGLMKVRSSTGDMRFRADAQAWRIAIEQGAEDDIAYVGYEVAGPAEFDAVAAKLSASGLAVDTNDTELCKARGVAGLIRCQDPDGLRIEIYFGPTERREIPFISPAGVSSFVTGRQGLGHVVLGTSDMAASRKFYQDLLGFRLSDIIGIKPRPDVDVDLEFFHCNPRHHSLALIPVRGAKRLQHFMLQAGTLDDVGSALDRATNARTPIAMTLGKHTNDMMVSFYAQTPSGFLVEYGWGGLEVDDATWRVVRHEKTSIWGHKRQQAH